MSISLVVTRGFGNGTLTGSPQDLITRGFSVGADADASGVGRLRAFEKGVPFTPLPDGVQYPDPVVKLFPGIQYEAPSIYEVEFEEKKIKALEATRKVAQEAKNASLVKQRKALKSIRDRQRRIDLGITGELTGIADAIKAEVQAVAQTKRTARAERVKAELDRTEAILAFELLVEQTNREIAAAKQRIDYQNEIIRHYKEMRRKWVRNQQAVAVLLLAM